MLLRFLRTWSTMWFLGLTFIISRCFIKNFSNLSLLLSYVHTKISLKLAPKWTTSTVSGNLVILCWETCHLLCLHIYSSWVKIRLRTKNQLHRLPGSALKIPGGWCVGRVGFYPLSCHSQLMLRLSWAVTTFQLVQRSVYVKQVWCFSVAFFDHQCINLS